MRRRRLQLLEPWALLDFGSVYWEHTAISMLTIWTRWCVKHTTLSCDSLNKVLHQTQHPDLNNYQLALRQERQLELTRVSQRLARIGLLTSGHTPGVQQKWFFTEKSLEYERNTIKQGVTSNVTPWVEQQWNELALLQRVGAIRDHLGLQQAKGGCWLISFFWSVSWRVVRSCCCARSSYI